MSDYAKTKIVGVAFLLTSIFLMVMLIVIVKDYKESQDKIKNYGIEVESVIDEIVITSERSGGETKKVYRVHIKYNDPEGNEYSYVLSRWNSTMQEGDTILIYVNKDDYNEVLYSGGITVAIVLLSLMVVVTFFVSVKILRS